MSTVMKMTLQKNSLKELYYRDYKKFDQAVFNNWGINWIMTFRVMRPMKKYSSKPWITKHL